MLLYQIFVYSNLFSIPSRFGISGFLFFAQCVTIEKECQLGDFLVDTFYPHQQTIK